MTGRRSPLALFFGSAALAVFDSERGGPRDDVSDRTAEDSAAHKERLLLMGRIGRGETSLENEGVALAE